MIVEQMNFFFIAEMVLVGVSAPASSAKHVTTKKLVDGYALGTIHVAVGTNDLLSVDVRHQYCITNM